MDYLAKITPRKNKLITPRKNEFNHGVLNNDVPLKGVPMKNDGVNPRIKETYNFAPAVTTRRVVTGIPLAKNETIISTPAVIGRSVLDSVLLAYGVLKENDEEFIATLTPQKDDAPPKKAHDDDEEFNAQITPTKYEILRKIHPRKLSITKWWTTIMTTAFRHTQEILVRNIP